jgi:hypothetical protein
VQTRRGSATSPVLLAVIFCGAALVRWRLAAVPLERDEGEYAYMGQLILAGDVPYVAAHNMKLPGTYYAYAGIMALLGERDVAIRIGLLVLNLVTIGLVYRLGRTLADETVGLVAAAAYAVLSIGPEVLGLTANAEHFVVLPVVAGTLLLAGPSPRARTTARLAAAGALFGLAYVMKQPGGAFVPLALLGTALPLDGRAPGRVTRDVAVVAVAAIVPFALTCLAMHAQGAFEPFWFWTVTYAREYVSFIPVAEGLAQFRAVAGRILASAPLLWTLAAVGLAVAVRDPTMRVARPLLLGFAACSAVAVSPGLRFSEHYFILALPAASLLAGVAVSALARMVADPRAAAALRVGLPVLALASAVLAERDVLLRLAPDAVSRAIFGVNPFPEAPVIGRWIAEHSSPADRIGVVGSEPELYFYARRRGATSFIYTYPLMEPHPFARRMQEDMITQLEQARPRFLVLVNVDTSWSRRPDSATAIFEWALRTVDRDYVAVGLVEIATDAPSAYWWDDAARAAVPRTRSYVTVFERRT